MKKIIPFGLSLLLAASLAFSQENKKEQVEGEKIEGEMMKIRYLSKGRKFFKEAEYDSAIKYLERSIKFVGEIGEGGNEYILSIENAYLAESYSRKGNLEKALEHFEIAKKYSEKDYNSGNIADCDFFCARILKEQGKTKKAIERLYDAIKLKEKSCLFENIDKGREMLENVKKIKNKKAREIVIGHYDILSMFYWEMTKYLSETESEVDGKDYLYFYERASLIDFSLE
jgi:tetratricopeptide (TPR) repeat protein